MFLDGLVRSLNVQQRSVCDMVGPKSPEIVVDEGRLSSELESYRDWLDENTEKAYQIAEEARSKGLDFADTVEIPRAADLASRTEKLLEEYLKPEPIPETKPDPLAQEETEPVDTVEQNRRHAGDGFDVVDHRRTGVQAGHRGKRWP